MFSAVILGSTTAVNRYPRSRASIARLMARLPEDDLEQTSARTQLSRGLEAPKQAERGPVLDGAA